MRDKRVSSPLIVIFLLFILTPLPSLLLPARVSAEFYSYEDKEGTLHYVDDLSKVPREYRQQKEVRKDEYDDLSDEGKAQWLERKRMESAEFEEREAERRELARERRAEEERKAAEEKQRNALITKVVIRGRQVFVPVKLAYGNAETETMLLLDTGASTSVITPQVADRLNIGETEYVRIGVVGGRVMKARKVMMSRMEVGPVSRSDQDVVVVPNGHGEYGDGLLGMSFLGGLKYTIDFQKQTINWIP